MKKFAKVNKIYLLMIFWAMWLFFLVIGFQATSIAMITFIIGLAISCAVGAYITDRPNEKEKNLLDKLANLFNDYNEID